jgi:hypothetical protein
MKKLIFLALILMMNGFTFGQVLPKGTLIGTHVIDVKLQPGVTMDQFIQQFSDKILPEMNKMDQDWKVYLLKSVRGNTNQNSFGLLHVVKSDKIRDKFFNADGSQTELSKSLMEKFNPLMEELGKYGTYTTQWTDWIIQ